MLYFSKKVGHIYIFFNRKSSILETLNDFLNENEKSIFQNAEFCDSFTALKIIYMKIVCILLQITPCNN